MALATGMICARNQCAMPRLIPKILAAFVSAISATAAQAASPEEIPFTFTDGFIRLEARIPQLQEPLYLLLDSGAGASVLSLRTAQRLHLALGKTQNVHGVGVEVAAYHLEGVRASASGTELGTLALAVDLSSADQLCSRPVDGLVGVDFFRNRVVQIDYLHHRLRVAGARATTKAGHLPVKLLNGVMCIPIAVNDSTVRWARFDTGCNDALHWVIPRPNSRQTEAAVSIGFITDENDTALTSVTLGRKTLSTVKTALHTRPIFPGEAGLVGNGLLSQYLVTVDWPHQRIALEDAPR